MNRFYVSEYTDFIDQLLAEHPEIVEDQRRGWHLFWDRQVDFTALREADQDQAEIAASEIDPSQHRISPARLMAH